MAETGVENGLYILFSFIVFLIVVAILIKYIIIPELNIDPNSMLDYTQLVVKKVGKFVGNFVGNIVI